MRSPFDVFYENGTYPVTRREILGGCFFDFANSSFSILILTIGYSVYFGQVVASTSDDNLEQLLELEVCVFDVSRRTVCACSGSNCDATVTRKHRLGW